MKVFVIANSSWNVNMLRLDFIQELSKRGHTVVTSHNSKNHDFKSLGCPDLEREISFIRIIKFLKLLLLNVRDKKNLLFSFSFCGNFLTGLCVTLGLVRCCFYPTVTGLGKPYSNIMLRLPYIFFMYIALIKAEKVFFHNEADLKIFTRFRLISYSRAVVVNGGGLKKFTTVSSKLSTQRMRFGTIARAIPEKGLHELLDCFADKHFSKNKLFILTDLHERRSDYTISLLNKIGNMNNVTILRSNHDKSSFFSDIDFFVLNSEREGRSRSIIESLSCGVPVVCKDVPGCRDIITDGMNGFLVDQSRCIKVGIMRAFTCSENEWQALSESAFASFTPYSVESIVDDYCNEIE
jgi:glycosyltransferase involved in cell wall biosynthesis